MMLIEGIAWFAVVFLSVRFGIAVGNLLTNVRLPDSLNNLETSEKISILIPVRNEAHNISALLEDLRQLDNENLEIWVYDDQSTDLTAKIVKDNASKDPRISLIRGKELPKGWKGKNHACHQLALRATGSYFLFLDADVRIGKGMLSAFTCMKQYRLDLLSVFPSQIMKTFGEKITVPIMNWILVSLLPLTLVRRMKSPALAAANGQFMLFNAEVYRKERWHEQVKNKTVEDIAIGQLLKQKKYRVGTFLGNRDIRCRMYHNYKDALDGFSKNVHAFFGNSHILLWFYVFITGVGLGFVWLTFGRLISFLYIADGLLMWLLVGWYSHQQPLKWIWMVPLIWLSLVIISVKSLKFRFSGKASWKGRIIEG